MRLGVISQKLLLSAAVSERAGAGFNGRMTRFLWMKSRECMIPFLDELKLYIRLEKDQLHIKYTFFELNKCSNYFVNPSSHANTHIYIYTSHIHTHIYISLTYGLTH